MVNIRKRMGSNKFTTYSDEIDYMLIWVPKIDKVLKFESENFIGKTDLHIRTEPTKNKQKKGCLFAVDHVW